MWWFVAGLSAIIIVGGAFAAWLPMRGWPYTVVQASSDAIVVQPAELLDVVHLARPRFGLSAPDRAFSGIPIEPPLPTHSFVAALGMPEHRDQPDSIALVQRFEVTPACQMSVERMEGPWVRVDVHSILADTAGNGGTSCSIGVELRGPPPEERAFLGEALVQPGRPASMQFRLADPLRLRAFSVTGLGFTTTESREVASAVRGAVVLLPEYGDRRDTLYAGDWLRLGALRGEVAEVRVEGDGIRTLFKGHASAPAIGSRQLAPSLLRQAFYTESLRFVVVLLVGAVSLFMAIFQVAYRN